MEDEFLNKIRKDLEKSGLGSELKACKIFEENNWIIQSGTSFYDKDESKSREIDIVGTYDMGIVSEFDEDEYISYNEFAISAEVKKSEKPWILFEKKRKGSIISELRINYINTKGFDLLTFVGGKDSLYYKERIGTGIHEAFKNPNDTSRWYGACLSTIKSMHSEIENENNMFGSNHVTHYTPLIILDGVLISAKMDDNSEICLEYIDRGFIDFEYESSHYEHKNYRVAVVTLDGLDSYLRRLKDIQYLIDSSLIELENLQNAVVNDYR